MTPGPPPAASRAVPTRKGGRAQARGDRTRSAIIGETVRCVNEEGFAAASANHIAERAGVTWGVIQYHFGDRNGLLAAVVTHGYRQFRSAIASVAVPEGPDRERVAAVVDAAWAAFASPESLASLEILVATRAGRHRTQAAELESMARAMRGLGGMLVGPARSGGGDRAVLGEVLWATLRGMALSQMLSPRPLDTRAERDVLVDLLTAFIESSPAPRGSRR